MTTPAADPPTEEIYLAGGCLWGVQAFVATLPGVTFTEAGRANGTGQALDGPYDGYVECVRTRFDPTVVTVERLVEYLFEIIDPYSVNRQGPDVGAKYRTGVYSTAPQHLERARAFLAARADADRIVVEVAPLENYIRSADEHQHRLARFPDDTCHVPAELLDKYRTSAAADSDDDPSAVDPAVASGAPVPVLRMFDVAAAREFDLDYLQFTSPHPRLSPGVDRDAPGGPTVELTDPSGNTLQWCEADVC